MSFNMRLAHISSYLTQHRLYISFFFHCSGDHRDLHSFPTRRSSDLSTNPPATPACRWRGPGGPGAAPPGRDPAHRREDRKSTRLNSSHDQISYAVFCLKKKKKTKKTYHPHTQDKGKIYVHSVQS